MSDQDFRVELDTTIRTDLENIKTLSLEIKNQGDRDTLSTHIKNASYIESRVVAFFKDMKSNAHKTWKSICNTESFYTDECRAFIKAANNSIIVYDDRQEKARKAEEERLQAIKDEENRLERERLAAEAEKKRKEEEKAKADAEAARQLAEDAEDNSSNINRERLIAEANEKERIAEEAKREAEAKEKEAARVKSELPKITVASTVTKQAGESVRITWKARVINASLVPRTYLMVNETALDKQAKATQNTVQIPGVEFYEEKTMVRRNPK
jgi:septal ring factor EnvC (AmiA/AmiB activator)